MIAFTLLRRLPRLSSLCRQILVCLKTEYTLKKWTAFRLYTESGPFAWDRFI